MVDNVIVTVICNSRDFDMELPANVKIAQLKPVISEALKRKGLRLNENFNLIGNENLLKDSDTLFETGVWDGSYLRIS